MELNMEEKMVQVKDSDIREADLVVVAHAHDGARK